MSEATSGVLERMPSVAEDAGNTLAGWPAGKMLKQKQVLDHLGRQTLTRSCGWNGCEVVFEGPWAETHNALAAHREESHPDFKPYVRPRRKREKRY